MDEDKPGTVIVESWDPSVRDYPHVVSIRRIDGSLHQLASFLERETADGDAKRVRDAVANDEAWVRDVINVSAGELRSA